MATAIPMNDDITAEQQAAINDELANALSARLASIHAVLAHRQLGIAVDVNPRTKIRYSTVEEQRLRETIKRETKEIMKQREMEAAKTARMMALGIKTVTDNTNEDETTNESTMITNGKNKQTRFHDRSPDSVSSSSLSSSSGSSSYSSSGSGSDSSSSDSEGIDGSVKSYSSSSESEGKKISKKSNKDKHLQNKSTTIGTDSKAKEKSSKDVRKGKKEVKVSKAAKGPTGLLAHQALYEGDASLGAHVQVGESALQVHARKGKKNNTAAGTGALGTSSSVSLKRGDSGVFDFSAVAEPLEESTVASPVNQKRKGLFELTKHKSFRHAPSTNKLVSPPSPSSLKPTDTATLQRKTSSNKSLILSPLNPKAGSSTGSLLRTGSTGSMKQVSNNTVPEPHHHHHHRRHHKHHHRKHHEHKTAPSAAALGDSTAIKALFVPGGEEMELARKAKGVALESRLRRLAAEELINNVVDVIHFDPLKTSLATVQETALKMVGTISNNSSTANNISNNSSTDNNNNPVLTTSTEEASSSSFSSSNDNSASVGDPSSSSDNSSSSLPPPPRETTDSSTPTENGKPSLVQNPSFPELAQHISKIMRWVACRINLSYDPRKFAYYFASPVAMDIVTDCFWLVHTRMFAEKARQKEARKEAKRKLAELLGNGRSAQGGSSHHSSLPAEDEDDEEEEEAALSVGTVLMPSAETLLATEVLVESLATQSYMLMKAVRTNKYLFAQFFPYAVADAVYHAFVFLLPGSKASYTNLFRLGVFTEITRLLSGVELAPTTVARMADSLFPDESTIARFKQQQGIVHTGTGKETSVRGHSRGSGAVSSGDESTTSKREKHQESDRKAQAMARALGFRSTFELFKTTTPSDRAYLGLDVTARVEVLRRLDRTTIIPTSAFLVTGTSVPPASVTASGSVTAFISPPSISHKRMYDHGSGHTANTLSHPDQFQDRVQKIQEGIPTVPPVLSVPDPNGFNPKALPSSTILMSPIRKGHTISPKKYITVRGTSGEHTRIAVSNSNHSSVLPSVVTAASASSVSVSSNTPHQQTLLPHHPIIDNVLGGNNSFPSTADHDQLVYKTAILAKASYKPPTLASSRLQSFLMHPKAWEATVGLVAGVAGDPTLLAAEPTVENEIDNDELRRAKILGIPPLVRTHSSSPSSSVSAAAVSTTKTPVHDFTGIIDDSTATVTTTTSTTTGSPQRTVSSTSRLSTADPPVSSASRTPTRSSPLSNPGGRNSPELIAQNKAIMENAALIAKARITIRDQIHVAEHAAVSKGGNATSAAVQAAVRAYNDTTQVLSPILQRNRLLPPLESLSIRPSPEGSLVKDNDTIPVSSSLSSLKIGDTPLFSPIKAEMDLNTDVIITDMGGDDGLASIAGIGTLPSVNPELAYRMLLARSKARPLLVPYVTTSTSTLLQRALPHVKANHIGGHRAMHRTVPVPWSRTGGVDTFRSYHGHMAGSTETGGIITDIDQTRKNNASKKKKHNGEDNEDDENEDLGGQLKDAALNVNIGVTTTAASIKATIAAVQAESLRARSKILKETRHQKEQFLHAGRGTIARAAQEIRMNRVRNRQARLSEMNRPSDTHLLRDLGEDTNTMNSTAGNKDVSSKDKDGKNSSSSNRTVTYDRTDPGMNGASMVYTNITIPPPMNGNNQHHHHHHNSGSSTNLNHNASHGNLGMGTESQKDTGTINAASTTANNNNTNKYTNTAVLQLNLMSVANFARSAGNFEGEPLAFGNPNKKAALASLASASSIPVPTAFELANPRGPRPNPEALVTAGGIGSVIEPLQNLPKKGISGMLEVYGGIAPGSTLAVTIEGLKNRSPDSSPTK